jgi:hypothetical protein
MGNDMKDMTAVLLLVEWAKYKCADTLNIEGKLL